MDNIRCVLDEMQKKVLTLEEENESLKKKVEFQQILFEKEKIDLIKSAEAGSQNEIQQLKFVIFIQSSICVVLYSVKRRLGLQKDKKFIFKQKMFKKEMKFQHLLMSL